MLFSAYFMMRAAKHYLILDESILLAIARTLEPDNKGQYRHLPVTFNGVVGGVSPQNIHSCIRAWIHYFNEEIKYSEDLKEVVVDPVIKEFLAIHPFRDGNGRTAWLLRVWMLNQWDDPQPLPDYFKEEVS
jgi:Fic family protein